MSKLICLFVLAMAGVCHATLDLTEFTKEMRELAVPTRNKCLNETGADIKDVENCSRGKFKDDIKLKKYLACVAVTFKVINPKTHELDLDRVYELSPPHIKAALPKIFKQCYNINKEYKELHDKMFYLIECYYKVDPENFIAI